VTCNFVASTAPARLPRIGPQPVDENIASSLGLPKDRGEIVTPLPQAALRPSAGIQPGDDCANQRPEVNPDQTVSFMITATAVGARIRST
jgi:serine protease Do